MIFQGLMESGTKIRAHALWHQKNLKAQILEEELRPLDEARIEIETLYSSVSIGAERLVAAEEVPRELWNTMHCPYMRGSFELPVKYGHSLVGKVSRGDPDLEGKLVHVKHPHQDRCVVKREDVFVLPDLVNPKRATLATDLEVALTALWDSRLVPGERALIVGFGMLGSMVARLASEFPAVEVVVADKSTKRLALAEKMGFRAVPPNEVSPEFDVVFHSSGSGVGCQLGLDSLMLEGRMVELSWYGDKEVKLQLGGTFHSMRKKIISSQISHLPGNMVSRWDENRRRVVCFRILSNPDWDSHLGPDVSFAFLPDAFKELMATQPVDLNYLVDYGARE